MMTNESDREDKIPSKALKKFEILNYLHFTQPVTLNSSSNSGNWKIVQIIQRFKDGQRTVAGRCRSITLTSFQLSKSRNNDKILAHFK